MRNAIISSVLFSTFLALAGCNGGGGTDGEGEDDASGPGGPGGPGGTSGTTGSSCAAVTQNLPLPGSRGTTPAIAWGGDAFGVAWSSLDKDEGDIHFALVDTSGALLGQSVVFEGVGASSVPSIAARGGGFVVVWRDADGKIRGRNLDGGGAPQGEAFEVGPTTNIDTRPSVASSAAGTVVAWSDVGQSFIGVLGTSGMTNQQTIANAMFPAVTGAGAKAGVAWSEGGTVGVSEVDPESLAMQSPVTRNATTAANLSLTSDGSRFFVAWEDLRSGEEEVYLSDGGEGEIRVHGESGSANWPSVTWTGSHVVAVYYQFRDGPPQIFLSLIGPDLVRATQDLEVTADGAARFPSVAWSGERLGVVWAVTDGGVETAMVECN
jgi:hypothetical protein